MATVLRANHEHPGLAALGTLAALVGRTAANARWRRTSRHWATDLFDVFDDDDESVIA